MICALLCCHRTDIVSQSHFHNMYVCVCVDVAFQYIEFCCLPDSFIARFEPCYMLNNEFFPAKTLISLSPCISCILWIGITYLYETVITMCHMPVRNMCMKFSHEKYVSLSVCYKHFYWLKCRDLLYYFILGFFFRFVFHFRCSVGLNVDFLMVVLLFIYAVCCFWLGKIPFQPSLIQAI